MDRQAVEAAWRDYWEVGLVLLKVPASQRRQNLSRVAVDPLLSDVITSAAQFQEEGVDNYGFVTHRFHWGPSVDGKNVALVGDCMDTSHSGSLNVKTKEKLTVGLPRDNAAIKFVRGSDNRWRAGHIQYLDAEC